MRICLPPSWMPVEPEAPPWFTEVAVSPMMTLTRSNGDVEFLGHHLADGDVQPMAHVHLAEKGRHAAVGVHRDVGRKLIGRERRLGALRVGLVDRQQGVERQAGADRDHQGAAAQQQRAAGERKCFVLCHDRLPQPITAAARLTAFKMLTWVPQRHFKPESASLISASVGFFLSRRKAAAVMIQPLMQ